MKTFMFGAISKDTGKVINLFRLSEHNFNEYDPIIFLRSLCAHQILLCIFCGAPVSLYQAEHNIWCFFCDSPDHSSSAFLHQIEPNDFQKKEEDYYNPEHFEDDDCI